jgi:hypothetical protein
LMWGTTDEAVANIICTWPAITSCRARAPPPCREIAGGRATAENVNDVSDMENRGRRCVQPMSNSARPTPSHRLDIALRQRDMAKDPQEHQHPLAAAHAGMQPGQSGKRRQMRTTSPGRNGRPGSSTSPRTSRARISAMT